MKEFCILLYCNQAMYDEKGYYNFSYGGYHYGKTNTFIEKFSNGEFTLTTDIKKAYRFTDDDECDACMEVMIKKGATNIPVWSYFHNDDYDKAYSKYNKVRSEVNKIRGRSYELSMHAAMDEMSARQQLEKANDELLNYPNFQCIHYPNKHWESNNNLQPSLMHRSIEQWRNRKNN